ncbi:MAG TPA: pyruvate dehydrogenase (acetyl-transferring) E1 component subunit alpha [Chloroflexota bacterium]|nr:pyruvate dehydrogenase (acetyl-transferring) E1 component subunit alpha [Chloroflexota bacterium]
MSKERSGRASIQSRPATDVVENERSDDPGVARYPRDQLIAMLAQMQLIRHFEERAAEQYTKARIGGYIHLNVGEEATVVGSVAALRPTDYLIGSYRTHGHALARGTDPRAVMAELFGREAGTSKGRGGSMHLFDKKHRFLGGYGIVGGHLPIAAGLGLAIDYLGGDEAVMCVFGEGATNIGAFHESLNVAKLWGLPVVWVCANNQYAMGHSVAMDSAVTEIHRKACAYDMPGERVDGMDVLAVRQACEAALERARRERLPSLVECVTYRYRGHSMADQRKYRTEDEVRAWRERDPINWFERRLIAAKLLDENEAKRIEREADEKAAAAVDFAEHAPDPDPADLGKYVYASDEEM